MGEKVVHRTNRYLNNRLEQDHRGIKGRYRPMRGFKELGAARRFCRAYDELRQFLRPMTAHKEPVSLGRRRAIHVQRVAALRDMTSAAKHHLKTLNKEPYARCPES
jgi:hypothetical protein